MDRDADCEIDVVGNDETNPILGKLTLSSGRSRTVRRGEER
jgi:hypothetical protein